MAPTTQQAALFIVPSMSKFQGGPMPAWLNAVGWASAAERILGEAWMLTLEGTFSPEDARRRTYGSGEATKSGATWRQRIPFVFRLAYKDMRQAVRARRFRKAGLEGPWENRNLAFVWQRHDMFYTTGHIVARHFRCPLVIFVAAPRVWEDRRWGIQRPAWGWLVESIGENRQLRSADLVACVSDEVAEEISRRGVPDERILVTPGSVDVNLFRPNSGGDDVRRRYCISNRKVVGWIGSFRSFHSIELAIEAVRVLQETTPDVALLLVGDGIERPSLERFSREVGIRDCIFTGAVAHDQVGSYLDAMDVALVLAREHDGFHYSPLKLREYLACGVPVAAPRVGELARILKHEQDAMLYSPGDAHDLARTIQTITDDSVLAARLSKNARARMVEEGSSENHIRRLLAKLESLQESA